MTDPRPDPDSELAGETEYGNDSGFAGAATEQEKREPADPTLQSGDDGGDASGSDESLTAGTEPPD